MQIKTIASISVCAALSGIAFGRTRPQIDFERHTSAALSGQALAYDYIESKLKALDAHVQAPKVQESLLGFHYVFQQIHGPQATPIDHATYKVSIMHDGKTIYRTFDSLVAGVNLPEDSIKLKAENAYDKAWQHLAPTGQLIAEPGAQLVIAPVGASKSFRYVWRVQLALSKPYGFWELLVDAQSGRIWQAVDNRIFLKDQVSTMVPRTPLSSSHKGITARHQAFKNYRLKNAAQEKFIRHGVITQGLGLIFDPDPKTALQNDQLRDNSPPEAFEDAYKQVKLLDITQSGPVYYLSGPWVNIVDFDFPDSPPTSTANGDWQGKRGNQQLNDVMTYYHIDRSQRYIQSLGFTNQRGIQFGSIKADANGANGDDNSYYSPFGNQLSFGHGCVDDNEDADVILHEYGHALNASIVPDWGGGDSGAIGEGFGDYWAASASLQIESGREYNPATVFQWDGGDCWSGRRLDRVNLKYDHNKTYRAHQSIENGKSDELWSTPLFQSLLALLDQGETQSSVDQVILESFFGLGPDVKMRDVAKAILQAAQMLHPQGPHTRIFAENFARQGILSLNQGALVPDFT